MNFLKGSSSADPSGAKVTFADGLSKTLNCDASISDVTVGVRPESIDVSLDETGDTTAVVQNFEQLGAITYIYSKLATGESLTVQLASQIPLERGQTIGVSFNDSTLHVFANTESGEALVHHER